MNTFLIKRIVYGVKFFSFKILTCKGFDHAFIFNRFPDPGIQNIQLCLHSGIAGERSADQQNERDHQKRNHDTQHRGKAQIELKRHDHGTDQHGGGTKHHAHQILHKLLDLRHVVGDSSDQGTRGEMIQIGKGILLHASENILAQVGTKARRRIHRKNRSTNTTDHSHQRNHHHQNTLLYDVGNIPVGNAVVDQVCRDFGQSDLHDRRKDHKHRTKQKEIPMSFDVRPIS